MSQPDRQFVSAGTGVDANPRLALSRKQAAAALGMSLRHFQRHVQPDLRCITSGQLRLYPMTELERWLDANRPAEVDRW